jgi:acetyl esterase
MNNDIKVLIGPSGMKRGIFRSRLSSLYAIPSGGPNQIERSMTISATSGSPWNGQLTAAAQTLLAQLRANGFESWSRLGLDGARAAIQGLIALAGPPEPVSRVENVVVPGADRADLLGKLYIPDAPPLLPVMVYMHGGGWTTGDYTLVDPIVRALANRSGYAILSLDYRLGPENKYPAAVEDVYDTVRWVVENANDWGLDPHSIGVGGDSSGGNLAAAVTLLCRDRGGPQLSFQLLVYPALDHHYQNESFQRFGDGLSSALSREDIAWFHQLYANSLEELDLPYLSPLRAASLAGVPRALLVQAEIDPLFQEGVEYADRLAAAGVPTERRVFPGMFHGFWRAAGVLEDARNAIDFAGAWMQGVRSEFVK